MIRHDRNARMAWLVLLGLAASALLRARPQEPQNKPAIPDPELIDARGYEDLIARHRGKPVMVYFWATWCEPCRHEYPVINELARKYASRGLVILGISMDDDADMNLVRRFLARGKPIFPNYRQKPGQDQPFRRTVNPKWHGAIPATFLYHPDGRQVAQLIGENKRATFEKAIQDLLGSASGENGAGRTP